LTYGVNESPKGKPAKKQTKGKKPEPIEEEQDEQPKDDDEDMALDAFKNKADSGDVKKRGKTPEQENNAQESIPAAARARGGKKKAASSVTNVEQEEDPVATGEGAGRGGGKRKKAGEKEKGPAAPMSASQPGPSGVAAKPKRGRPAKKITDEDEDAF